MFKKLEPKRICNTTLIGDWEEINGVPASTITKNDADTALLDGLIIKGYEMKFGAVNENGEKYEKEAFTAYIQKYFVDNKLNIPVDLQHYTDFDNTIGRVIYAEVNNVGLYFVAYVPKGVSQYEQLKLKLKEGIIQGFSKYGWATDYEYIYTKDGYFDYMLIKEFQLLSVSLVTTPANAVNFEGVKETKNMTTFVDNIEDGCKKKNKKKFFK